MVKHLVELSIAKSDIAFLRVLSKNSEFICPTLITKGNIFLSKCFCILCDSITLYFELRQRKDCYESHLT